MKKDLIQQPLFQQFRYEVESWARLVAFYKDEVGHDKLLLVEFVNGGESDEALVIAGRLQEEFQPLERLIDRLWSELKQQAQLLDEEFYLDDDASAGLKNVQRKLRREIALAEELFAQTRNDFIRSLLHF